MNLGQYSPVGPCTQLVILRLSDFSKTVNYKLQQLSDLYKYLEIFTSFVHVFAWIYLFQIELKIMWLLLKTSLIYVIRTGS